MKRKLNVSIIVLDTLKLEMFNRIISQNPNMIKNFNAVRFENCIAPGSWTLPSHASLFTGLYQSEHECHETKEIKSLDIDRIKLTKRTILEKFKDMRYSTYGISANPYIHPVYGFKGFDTYIAESYFTDLFGSVIEVSNELKPRIAKYRNLYGSDVLKLSHAVAKEDPKLFLDLALSATMLTPKAAMKKIKAKFIDGWPVEKGGSSILKTIRNLEFKQPFFLFVNFMEAHDPYIGAKGKDFNWVTPFLKKETDQKLLHSWRKLYDKASIKAMRYGTELIRNLLERFGDDQIIILTSDHGQLFGEYGFIGHGTVIYDEMIKVPLLVILPKSFNKNVKAKGYQSLVNIPTFIEAALSGDKDAISKLTTASVIAETFSIPANIANIKGVDKRKMAKFDKYQKRVFK
ncbi:MAG: sulfatase-like hydrolase/transferase [Candidatus Micrarchaeaceae archaeon]